MPPNANRLREKGERRKERTEMGEAIVALIRLGLNALKKREEPGVHAIPEPHIPPFKPPEKWPDHYEFKK